MPETDINHKGRQRLKKLFEESGKGKEKPLRVLLVDDSPLSRVRILRALEDSGIIPTEVFEVGNGHEALPIIKNNEIQLLFTDYHMPRMNGLQLCHILSEMEKLDDICAILLTVEKNPEIVQEIMDLGLTAYIAKPIAAETFGSLLE